MRGPANSIQSERISERTNHERPSRMAADFSGRQGADRVDLHRRYRRTLLYWIHCWIQRWSDFSMNSDALVSHEMWLCNKCHKLVDPASALHGMHPFEKGRTVLGCPHCLEMDSLVVACHVDGCANPGTSGCLHGDGVYRIFCHEHFYLCGR